MTALSRENAYGEIWKVGIEQYCWTANKAILLCGALKALNPESRPTWHRRWPMYRVLVFFKEADHG